jgi:hypothetical protein
VAKLGEGKWCGHPQQQNSWGGKMNILNGKKSWFSALTKLKFLIKIKLNVIKIVIFVTSQYFFKVAVVITQTRHQKTRYATVLP